MAQERQAWEKKWSDIRKYGFPYYGDGLSDNDDGDIQDEELTNDYPSECLDIYVSGLQGATSSSTSNWFSVEINNPLEETSHDISVYLNNLTKIIYFWMQRSNFFEAKREQLAEMAIFGSAPLLIEEGDVFSSYTYEQGNDEETPFYFIPISCGSYYLGKNKRGDVDTLIREFTLNARNLVDEFKDDAPDSIRSEAEKFSLTTKYCITQVIMPRYKFKIKLPVNDDYKYLSFYYLEGVKTSGVDIGTINGKTKGGLLRVDGYFEQPFACPQEKPKIANSYSHSIGEFVRGNVKGLQMLENDLYELLEKIVDPSVQGPADHVNEIFTEAGSVNAVEAGAGDARITPIYTPQNGSSVELNNVINRVEQKIYKRFYCDLFFAVTEKARNIKTAFEASLIDGERFTKLVPTIERLARTDSVILERIFNILQRNGLADTCSGIT